VVAVLTAAAGVLLAACGGSDAVDPAALPAAGTPAIGRSLDLALTDGPTALPRFDDGNGHATAEAGRGYRLGLRENESVVSSTRPEALPPDQAVEASFSTEGSPPDAAFGVICRAQSNDTYYRLGVGNDGTYAIARVQDGASTVLTGGGKWRRDERLSEAPGFFLVGAECRGEELTLFVNDVAIVAVHDVAPAGSGLDGPGRAGVFVETFVEPDATVTVNHVAVRAFGDREKLSDTTVGRFDAFARRQHVAERCTLLDPARADVPGSPRIVTRCGDVLYALYPDSPRAARAYYRLLEAADTTYEESRRLPHCARRTGVVGPGPTPGRLACLDLGDRTAVAWWDERARMLGVVRVSEDDRGAWRSYGPAWPPFVVDP
jgi:hypothetical protein